MLMLMLRKLVLFSMLRMSSRLEPSSGPVCILAWLAHAPIREAASPLYFDIKCQDNACRCWALSYVPGGFHIEGGNQMKAEGARSTWVPETRTKSIKTFKEYM